ncbi:LysR family transcriptional regulator [Paenibacillus massiliensis]|uniref:LysR family transcriptional regulator n=1 Tax=Paenibacillus massiliensis TaxID=225917 RepID=UPI000368572D|nr:LysR family transcriptional regulator [Paenibacillus massiliensis]
MFVNLELYRIFYVTAKMGSFSKAAAELFTSQPAISQAIKQLENKLGGALFYRNARGVTLTVEGEVLFRYIEPGYHMMLTAERKFDELQQLNAGNIRIAVCSAVCKYELLEAISQYCHVNPAITIDIVDQSSQEIARRLNLGEIDIGIMNLRNWDEHTATVVKKIEVQDCFVAGTRYEHLSRQPIHIRELAQNYPLILLQKGGSTREYIENYFHKCGIRLSPKIELSHLDLMVEFAVNGLGIACVAKEYVLRELKSRQLVEIPLQESIPPRHLVAAIKKGMPLSTAAQAFIDIFVGMNATSPSDAASNQA